MIKIDFCQKKEIFKVQEFINDHWKKGHILAQNDILFKWLYKNKDGYNFLIAKKNENIIGALGFIKNSHFDPVITNNDIIWLALWKVNEKEAPPGLGLILLKKLENINPNKTIAVLGINQDHPRIYKAINYDTGIMDHFYFTNPDIKNFRVLMNDKHKKLPTPKISSCKLISKNILISDLDKIDYNYKSKNFSNKKTAKYFINKYLNNPFYNYQLFHLQKTDAQIALIVLRVINIENSKIIRVIDFEGDESLISHAGDFFLKIIKKEKAEYIDFLQYGIQRKYFLRCGFELLNTHNDIIVPNYFEPFIQKNIPLLFSYKFNNDKIRIFKGDGDQDRPSLVAK